MGKDLFASTNQIIAPGVYDAFTAHLATMAGFNTLYVSGASIAYTKLGRPDVGLVAMPEVAETVARIADRTDACLIVDADTGYGNALNVQRTIRTFERSGATAIQLEDQSFPKRCGHLTGKVLIPTGEMTGKIKAATDARHSDKTLIVARTDAIGVEGFEAAMARAGHYISAGADLLFIEAPRDDRQLGLVCREFGERIPLIANMVEGGQTPSHDAGELHAMGFSVVIFPGGIVRALVRQAQDYYASLKLHGTNAPLAHRMANLDQLNQIIGLPEVLALGRSYQSSGD